MFPGLYKTGFVATVKLKSIVSLPFRELLALTLTGCAFKNPGVVKVTRALLQDVSGLLI
jgi:hypothetical protein